MDTRRAPKRIFDAHPPDQNAQLRLDLRSPSVWARLPTPVAAKAGPVPTHQRLGTDDRENLQDRRKPPIQLNKEPTIVVRQPWPTAHLAPQNDQLWSTAFSASSRLFDLNGEEPKSPERNVVARSFRQLRRFLHLINADKVFGTHRYLSFRIFGFVVVL